MAGLRQGRGGEGGPSGRRATGTDGLHSGLFLTGRADGRRQAGEPSVVTETAPAARRPGVRPRCRARLATGPPFPSCSPAGAVSGVSAVSVSGCHSGTVKARYPRAVARPRRAAARILARVGRRAGPRHRRSVTGPPRWACAASRRGASDRARAACTALARTSRRGAGPPHVPALSRSATPTRRVGRPVP